MSGDPVAWNPGLSMIIMCLSDSTMPHLSIVSAVSAWYQQSAVHEDWFDPERHGEMDLTLFFTDFEPPDGGKARLYRGRGPGGLPKTTYNRRFTCADLPTTIDRAAWVTQIARHHEALSAIGTRLGLPDPPARPEPEDCMPFVLPFEDTGDEDRHDQKH